MHKWLCFSIIILLGTLSCSENSNRMQATNIQQGTISVVSQAKGSNQGKDTFILAAKLRTEAAIRHYTDSIDSMVTHGSLVIETEFGYKDLPCEIVKYGNESNVLKLQFGCGDCSPDMYRSRYYMDGNELVAYENYELHYRYPPCVKKAELQEWGIDTNNLDKLKTDWTDSYLVLDSSQVKFHSDKNDSIVEYPRSEVNWQQVITELNSLMLYSEEPMH